MKAEGYSVQADLLLQKAANIHLGPQNKTLLVQQAKSTREAVTQLQDHLSNKYDLECTFFSELCNRRLVRKYKGINNPFFNKCKQDI